ncbi:MULTISPECIES: helix-turn-helix domain-containing protein [Rufibacter]|uniref:AraC-like DNA-binding protein n=1 Tax=Rufibacter quisquiliarum TaxID=1549639 RepID=A0A839GQL7_9BACT|nr:MULTISPECIES: helix-turn-helix domain-containing protein [Rufibacter]MBA9076131.1 AraC-like DNA-binding protein [Rufibacter quisquiliarum]
MAETDFKYLPVNPADVEHVIQFMSMVYPVSQELMNELHAHAICLRLESGEHLLRQGGLCHYMYFIREGALLAYSEHKKKKITTYISVENEFVSSLSGLYAQQPSLEAIVAVEPSLLVGVHTDKLLEWYQRFFDLNFIVRKVYEAYYRDAQERAHLVRIGNATERYRYFLKSKPGLIERLPLELIASFLDMKPETLARIRKQQAVMPRDAAHAAIVAHVEQCFRQEKTFKRKSIKIGSLAEQLGIPAYKLSQAINAHCGLSFKDFLNQFRINYLKQQLAEPDNLQNFTIESLALQAGFTSRSGFYSAFRKVEGISPKEYIALHALETQLI